MLSSLTDSLPQEDFVFEAARLQPQPVELTAARTPIGVQSDLMTKIWFRIMLHHTVSTSNTGKHGIYYLID